MNIKLNGKCANINCDSIEELLTSYCDSKDNIVVIKNGFCLSGDCKIYENDEIFIIDKSKMPSKQELKAMMYARHTPKLAEKFSKAKVAVAGLGGLGSNIAVSLARAGIGNLHLVDFDVVEPSNLNRQQYFISHLGMAKTQAMKNLISQINPYIKVTCNNVKITEDNISELFCDDEIICEAFDNPSAKATLVNGILCEFKDKKIVASSGMAGIESSNSIKTKRINNRFFICGDGKTEAKEGQGLMSARVMVCAGHQANMVLRLISGEFTV